MTLPAPRAGPPRRQPVPARVTTRTARPGLDDAAAAAREAVASALASLAPAAADAPVVLAVSGGRDSVAMALAARHLGRRAHVVHVDHGLRPDSASDARFVLDLAGRLDLPASAVSAPPTPADPARSETAARRRRLAALAGEARRLGARWILLAHHLDDDLETIALHLRRGHRGDRAAAGMPCWRPLDATRAPAERVHLLRPFLFPPRPLGRDDLARACAAGGCGHRDDPTNADLGVPRNLLRERLARDAGLRADLLDLRARSRRRLARRLAHVASALQCHLHADGLGARLDGEALEPPDGDARSEHLGELLRLLGATLARPRRVDVRSTVLARVEDLARRGRGRLELPARPAPIGLLGSRDGLRLPHDPPAPGSPPARALRALLASPPPGPG